MQACVSHRTASVQKDGDNRLQAEGQAIRKLPVNLLILFKESP